MSLDQVMGFNPFLNRQAQLAHRQQNLLHSALLIGGIALILVLASALMAGLFGVILALGAVAFLVVAAPRLPAEATMKLYRAKPIQSGASPLRLVLDELTARAKLSHRPQLYVIPSATLNAFATGTQDKAAIAVTEGLLRQLSMREITGVFAHEISHIRNNDLRILGLADIMSRFVQTTSYAALFLALLNLLGMTSGSPPVSWLAIALLYLAPTLTSLLQLGLSRAREFDADLEAAMLTGDPTGLASALRRVDNATGRFWEDLMMPVPARRTPQPSLLRTHPPTEERIERLLALKPASTLPPLQVSETPMVSMIGMGPIQMRPRYRFPGVWF
ncbi:MAG: zinc metalloprotease HtpX [Pseudomonadota bacterium]